MGAGLIKVVSIVKGVMTVFGMMTPTTSLMGKAFALSGKLVGQGLTSIGGGLKAIPVTQMLATTASIIGLAGGVWILSKAAM